METEFIEISWTTGNLEEARKIARYLVQERIVACSQIIPWIESIYMWNNQLETAQETKVVFKTRKEKYDAVKEIIEQNCTYQVPEITYKMINGGNKAYLDWLQDSVLSLR